MWVVYYSEMRLKEIEPDRYCLRQQLSFVAEAIDSTMPQEWWRSSARKIISLERTLCQLSFPQIQADVTSIINELKCVLREATKQQFLASDSEALANEIAAYTEHKIMEISMMMAKAYEPELLEIEQHFISLHELVTKYPGRLRIKDDVVNTISVTILEVKHPISDYWYSIPLPKGENIWHKGGPARAVLNSIANAPLSMQLAEFPWNDLDVITAGDDMRNRDVAIDIGVDEDGVEYMGEEGLNFSRFAYGRDTDQNQCCLGSDGLYYSSTALEAAKTGHINIVGKYIANKAIYGVDSLFIEGIALIKARGLMRLLKNVSEGKALSFDYKPINNNFDVGIYILFLAKKWYKRENRGELLQNLFYLLQQMGQVKSNETSIMDVLERAHLDYPFFDFGREIKSKVDLTKWKVKKFAKQIEREATWKYGFSAQFELDRLPNDETPVTITLGDFKASQDESARIDTWFAGFIDRSNQRTSETHAKGLTMIERLFLKDDQTVFDSSVVIDD